MLYHRLVGINSYFARVSSALESVDSEDIGKVVDLFKTIVIDNHSIWFMGNGGSAATANHAAIDMIKAFEVTKVRIRAHSLSANSSIITALANDISFEEIFAFQINSLAKPGDLVVSISASGNSSNLVRGVEEALYLGCKTLSIVGFDGGALAKKSDLSLIFRTSIGDYGVAEDSHSIFLHFLCQTLRDSLGK